MKFKKALIVICVMICLFSISSIAAGEIDENLTASDTDDATVTIDDEKPISTPQEDVIGNLDDGTFEGLEERINASGIIELENDYSDNGTLGEKGITIRNSTTIEGKGHSLDANSKSRIFTIENGNVTLKNMVFINGYSSDCGGAISILNSANVIIKDCTFINCTSPLGGAIKTEYTNNEITNCNFYNCTSANGGAIKTKDSISDITNCYFEGCNASVDGGAIHLGLTDGWQVVSGLLGASADVSPAPLSSSRRNVISGCIFRNCGGADSTDSVYLMYTCGDQIINCSFENCTTQFGGAIYYYDSDNGTVAYCAFKNSGASIKGSNALVACCSFEDGKSGISFSGRNNTIEYCSFENVSGTAVNSPNCLQHCTFKNCKDLLYGRTIVSISGTNSSIYNCSFEDCASLDWVMKIYESNASVSNCVFNNCGVNNKNTLDTNAAGIIYIYYRTHINMTNCSFNHRKSNYAIKDVGLDGNIVDCSFERTVVQLSQNKNMENCLFKNCDLPLFVLGDSNTINYCSFENCSGNPAILEIVGNNNTVSNCAFENEWFEDSSRAIYVFDSYNLIDNCTFKNFKFVAAAGTVSITSNYNTIANCLFENCRVENQGGAIHISASYNGIYNCTFENCSSGASGGVVLLEKSSNTIDNSSFKNCVAGEEGGAIAIFGGDTNITNCAFENCAAGKWGGAIVISQAANNNLINNTFKDASSPLGGFIYLEKSTDTAISHCTFEKGNATDGGAVCIDKNSAASINGCCFEDCTATQRGGAICILKTAAISDCTFRDCYDANREAVYGGLAMNSTVNNTGDNNGSASGTNGTGSNGTSGNGTGTNPGTNTSTGNGTSGDINVNTTTGNGTGVNPDINSTIGNGTGENGTGGNGSAIVQPENLNLTISVNSVDYGNPIRITITTNNAFTGEILVQIGNNNHTIIVTNGTGSMDVSGLNAGNYDAKAIFNGDTTFDADDANETFTVSKLKTSVSAAKVTTTYGTSKNIVVTLKDAKGKVLSNRKVSVVLNGKTYNAKTNSKGQASVAVPKTLAAKTYTATVTYAGETNYLKSTSKVSVAVGKATPKMTAKAKTFKVNDKTKKYTLTLKTDKGAALKGGKVTLKVNGKTYSVKTASNGVATFKLTKLTKKGKFKASIKYVGNANYKAVTKSAYITVK